MASLEERAQRVICILKHMPKRNRDVFMLRVIDELSDAAISKKLNISIENVHRRLAFAYDFYFWASYQDDEQLETPLTLIYLVHRIRSHFC